ncbi:hypothetical protein BX666DRAFT_1999052 [Dichotomocladium elegans]|nr:hypothetical protein BX666DRAFT_1999052 [Dichotomocladium elegans]
MVALQQQEQQQQQQQQQLLHVDSSCLTCAYVHPSAVVVKTEETQDEQCPQDTWGIPSITATPIMTKDLPAMQEQARMDYGDNTHDGEDEVLSGQDTDDSQSVFESPFDDDTEFEPMDEEDTYDDDDDDDDDEYTETKRAVRSSRRHDTQPQKQKSRASKQATRRKDGDNDKSAENSDEGILATRRIFRTPRHHTRRTATSYDAETTHYLKSVFFSIYSKRDKLTKEQRRQVQIHTGLKPRNITYWFSNHKRRFQRALKVYKQTVQKTGGAIKSYDDFLLWRRRHGLTDEVLDDEEEGPDEDMASPIPPTPQMTTDGDTTSSSPWTLP